MKFILNNNLFSFSTKTKLKKKTKKLKGDKCKKKMSINKWDNLNMNEQINIHKEDEYKEDECKRRYYIIIDLLNTKT